MKMFSMNWKFLLFLTAAVSSVKAQQSPCPAVNQDSCPTDAVTNFNFVGQSTTWSWTSGSVSGVAIYNTGLIAFNPTQASFPINGICIQWTDGSYTYVTRPSDTNSDCNLTPFTKSINNAWGYDG